MKFKASSVESVLRYPTMLVAGLSLLLAILGGLARMGIILPSLPGRIAFHHGGLMVSGFLGTLIAMERAISLPIPGSMLVPVSSAVGSLFLLLGFRPSFGVLLIVLASLGLLGLFGYIVSLQPSLHNSVLVIGALAWSGGNLLWWFHWPIHEFVRWWMGFLVFVIAAERLELNRLKQFSRFETGIFATGALLVLFGLFESSVKPYKLTPTFEVGLLVLSLWLFKNDMVRQMLSTPGKRGYTGWCLVTGYVWLGIGSLIGLMYPQANAGFFYDAYLHAVFLGFIFTMIFGHAFIIMPGVLDVDLNFHGLFYFPLVLLEASLLLRVGGDLIKSQPYRQIGGIGNGLAIVLFLLMILVTAVRTTATNDPRSSSEPARNPKS